MHSLEYECVRLSRIFCCILARHKNNVRNRLSPKKLCHADRVEGADKKIITIMEPACTVSISDSSLPYTIKKYIGVISILRYHKNPLRSTT